MGELTGTRAAATATSDLELLRRYARDGDERAFAQLVGRHAAWVYAASVRQVGDADLAEDVTQAVFILLARRAGSLADGTRLAGWLFNTVRFAAAEARRKRARRRKHEAQAAVAAGAAGADADADGSGAWERLAPVLDETLALLREADRQAVVLRYFENRDFADVAAAMGVNEDAARKRVSRALRRLRELLVRRGAIAPAVAVLAAMLTRSASAADVPAGLADRAAAGALGAASAAATPASLSIVLHTSARILRARRRLAVAVLSCAVACAVGGLALMIAWVRPPADESLIDRHDRPLDTAGPDHVYVIEDDPSFRLDGRPVRGRLELRAAPPAAASRPAVAPVRVEAFDLDRLWFLRPFLEGRAADRPAGKAGDRAAAADARHAPPPPAPPDEDADDEMENPYGSFAQLGGGGGGGGGAGRTDEGKGGAAAAAARGGGVAAVTSRGGGGAGGGAAAASAESGGSDPSAPVFAGQSANTVVDLQVPYGSALITLAPDGHLTVHAGTEEADLTLVARAGSWRVVIDAGGDEHIVRYSTDPSPPQPAVISWILQRHHGILAPPPDAGGVVGPYSAAYLAAAAGGSAPPAPTNAEPFAATQVPEPAATALFAVTFAAAVASRRRRRARS